MVQSIPASPRSQFRSLRQRLGQQSGLPFLELLSRAKVETVCRQINHCGRDRIYSPWITLGLFLSQVLAADQTCDQAVDRFQKCRGDQKLPPVSADTSSYCAARVRLPVAEKRGQEPNLRMAPDPVFSLECAIAYSGSLPGIPPGFAGGIIVLTQPLG